MSGHAYDVAHMLAGGLVLVSFMLLYQDRMFALLNIFALHALMLSGSLAWQAYIQGVLSDLGNPKIAAFFSSMLPQFAPAGATDFVGLAALGLLFSAMTLVWLTGYALATVRMRDTLSRPKALDTSRFRASVSQSSTFTSLPM